MKTKLYLTTAVFALCALASFGQMANTDFATDPMASDSADAVNFKFTTSLQQYVHEYILCRTVGGNTVEVGRQAGYEYMSVPIDYVFVDTDPVQGQSATYELKMVDNMDTNLVTVIGTVMHTFVDVEELGVFKFEQVYPNPVMNQLNVRIERQKETSWLEIRDLRGKLLLSNQIAAGQQSFVFDTQSLPAGSYTLSLRTGNDLGTRMIIKH